jgi:hypothetical protein
MGLCFKIDRQSIRPLSAMDSRNVDKQLALLTGHGGSLDARKVRIPVRPEEHPANDQRSHSIRPSTNLTDYEDTIVHRNSTDGKSLHFFVSQNPLKKIDGKNLSKFKKKMTENSDL